MRPLSRRGFALVELLLSLVLLALFGGVATALVTGAARSAGHALQALLIDRTVQSLRTFLEQELRDAIDTDVVSISPTRLSLARPIGDAIACAVSDTSVFIADTAWVGTRAPQAGRDDAWVLVDPVAGVWQVSAIIGVSSDRCPAGNTPALSLVLAPPPSTAAAVRVMEPVELSAYRSGAADWFGITPASRASPVQPFAGPLTPAATRFTLSTGYLETAVQPNRARAITVRTPLGGP